MRAGAIQARKACHARALCYRLLGMPLSTRGCSARRVWSRMRGLASARLRGAAASMPLFAGVPAESMGLFRLPLKMSAVAASFHVKGLSLPIWAGRRG